MAAEKLAEELGSGTSLEKIAQDYLGAGGGVGWAGYGFGPDPLLAANHRLLPAGSVRLEQAGWRGWRKLGSDWTQSLSGLRLSPAFSLQALILSMFLHF